VRPAPRPSRICRVATPLGVTCAVALVLAGCGQKVESASATVPSARPANPAQIEVPADSPMLRRIRVEAVGTIEVPTTEVIAPGKIELNPGRVSKVLLPLAGRISEVLVRLGDAVREGQPLLAIESPESNVAEAAYLQAEAAVTQARSALTKAQADYDRAADLFEHNAIAKKEVLNAENARAQAKAGLDQSLALDEQASRRLTMLGLKPGAFGQRIEVRSPLAGKVLEIAVAAGEYRNDTNAPLMTVADLRTVWVSSDVPESYIRFIKVGERVDVELVAYPGEVFRARVTRLSDTVDSQTRTVKVFAEMDNSRGRFRTDMFGRIRHTEEVQRLPAVPAAAVIQDDGRTFVYVERGPGQFEQREVTLRKRSGDSLPVAAGLRAGERVIADGAILLKDGL
jgi:cobalt-zinc-cadmium efflux system membrane fusion protein